MKVLRTRKGPWAQPALERFRREVRLSELLHQEGIAVVRIIDHGVEVNEPYYVMTLIEDTLRAVLKRNELANARTALGLLRRLRDVLVELHRFPSAHRDLKPENILIDAQREPILCDLGIAWAYADDESGDALTETLEQLGSRHYMPPEALAGRRDGANYHAFDMYAYGKIFYEVFGGRQLPGVELPRGVFHLREVTPSLGGAASIANDIVEGLVAHDVEQRVAAWRRLDRDRELFSEALNGLPAQRSITALGHELAEALERNDRTRPVRLFARRRELALALLRTCDTAIEEIDPFRALQGRDFRPFKLSSGCHVPSAGYRDRLQQHRAFPRGASIILSEHDQLLQLFAVNGSRSTDSLALLIVPVALDATTVSCLAVSNGYSIEPMDDCVSISRVAELGPYALGATISQPLITAWLHTVVREWLADIVEWVRELEAQD